MLKCLLCHGYLRSKNEIQPHLLGFHRINLEALNANKNNGCPLCNREVESIYLLRHLVVFHRLKENEIAQQLLNNQIKRADLLTLCEKSVKRKSRKSNGR